MNFIKTLLTGAIAVTVSWSASAADISGAGATFPYPIYAKWADAYKKETGVGLNYQSIGSGGGIKQIKAKTVTFGASDAPLSGKDLDESGLAQFPMVMGAINRAKRRFYLRPGYMVRHAGDITRLALTKWGVASHVASRILFGSPVTDAVKGKTEGVVPRSVENSGGLHR